MFDKERGVGDRESGVVVVVVVALGYNLASDFPGDNIHVCVSITAVSHALLKENNKSGGQRHVCCTCVHVHRLVTSLIRGALSLNLYLFVAVSARKRSPRSLCISSRAHPSVSHKRKSGKQDNCEICRF